MTVEQEVKMFGVRLDVLKDSFDGSYALTGPAMLVMSILSDVQELLALIPDDGTGYTGERLELARQLINRAKFGVAEYLRG